MLKPSKSLFDDYGIASKKPVDAPDKRLATKTSKGKETHPQDRVDVLMAEIQEILSAASKTLTSALAAIAPKINEIRNEKLYLKYADNFTDFCQWKLGASRSLVYQSLKDLAIRESSDKVVQTLSSPTLIENDLHKPEPEKQIRATKNKPSDIPLYYNRETHEDTFIKPVIREPATGFIEQCDDIVIRLRSSRSMHVLEGVRLLLEENGF
jgi:hypothetical protein